MVLFFMLSTYFSTNVENLFENFDKTWKVPP